MFASFKSSLRVYEPLWAFDPAERSRWTRYVLQQQSSGSLERERGAMLQAVLGPSIDVRRLAVEEDALVAEWSGNRVLCPLDTQTRALQAIIDSEWVLPFPLAEITVGRNVRRQASGQQLRPRSMTERRAKDHVLTANWDVPFWWSLLFVREDAVPAEDLDSLTYRAAIDDAKGRGQRALDLIAETFGPTPFVGDLETAVSWLGTFDRDSMVELDYGSLGALVASLSDEADDSMALAGEAISLLSEGNLEEAMHAYRDYVSTWEDVARLEGWN